MSVCTIFQDVISLSILSAFHLACITNTCDPSVTAPNLLIGALN